MGWIAAGTAGVFLILAAAGIFLTFKYRKREQQECEAQQSVFVSKGVNVEGQILGSQKGAYFTGNLEEQATILVHHPMPQQNVCRITFWDMDRGEAIQAQFQKRLWCGRYPNQNPGEDQVVLGKDPQMSRTHFVIEVCDSQNQLRISDVNSRSHTYVNGQRVTAPVFITSGDTIQAGNTRWKIEIR